MAKKKTPTKIEIAEDLDILKIKYDQLKKKYSLPEFKKLNEEFDMGKIDFNGETILRDVRKGMITKFFSILTFVEMLINPSNGSMFYMYLVRWVDNGDKEKLKTLFDQLGKIEIESFKLDITYSESDEAKFIKEKTEEWEKELKPTLADILNKLEINWKKISQKKEKSYFG